MSPSALHEKTSQRTKVDIPRDFFSQWYIAKGRMFPWRDVGVSPFGIIIAEILLKQTRAENVVGVWLDLMRLYPTAGDLATADRESLLDVVARLGFGNQRTSALLDLAVALEEVGDVPADPAELMNLPYVGMYTSHAVASFSFNKRVPVVDINVMRVFSRVAGLDPPTDLRRAPDIWEIAWELLPYRLVLEHNYGLLDFAAGICKSRSPLCGECPIETICAYGQEQAAVEIG